MSGRRSRTVRTAGLLAATTLTGGLATATPAIALEGTAAKDKAYAFTAKVSVADEQACSGVLVDPQWVLTAKSCFAKDGKPAQAGKPKSKTTVTVGRSDLSQAGGAVLEAVELVPHATRDLVMVKLARRTQGISPVQLAATGPAVGEQLTVAGFGRTKTEWVPDKLHSAPFTVAAVSGGAVSLNGSNTSVVCQGDAGGPALRVRNGVLELVAVNISSWQGGCLGTDETETRTGATDARVDDIAPWIRKTAFRAQGDMTGDGTADLAAIWGDGTLHRYKGDGKGDFGDDTPMPGGTTWKTMLKIT